jgi:hypothetical protein
VEVHAMTAADGKTTSRMLLVDSSSAAVYYRHAPWNRSHTGSMVEVKRLVVTMCFSTDFITSALHMQLLLSQQLRLVRLDSMHELARLILHVLPPDQAVEQNEAP